MHVVLFPTAAPWRRAAVVGRKVVARAVSGAGGGTKGNEHIRANYDEIAEAYLDLRTGEPWRDIIEKPTVDRLLSQAIGGASSKQPLALLDLACGSGYWTRHLRSKFPTAESITGLDISAAEVEMAVQAEGEHQEGEGGGPTINYRVQDCCALDSLPAFASMADVVTAMYLFNYAVSREMLQGFSRAVAYSLKPGGRFVGLTADDKWTFADSPSWRKYNFSYEPLLEEAGAMTSEREKRWPPMDEGGEFVVRMFQGEKDITFPNIYWKRATVATALAEEGLRDVEFVELRPEPDVDNQPAGHWDAFNAVVAFTATKPS